MPKIDGPKDPARVALVASRLKAGVRQADIARELGISRNAVSAIVFKWIRKNRDTRVRAPRPKVIVGVKAVGPPSPAMIALAQFDPIVARALALRGGSNVPPVE